MTALWTAAELQAATGGALTAAFDATGVSIDTRTLRPGDLFVALEGENGDGHAFVAAAFEKGAAGALVHRDLPEIDLLDLHSRPLLRVEDTLAALRRLATAARERFAGRLVAVTGSVGKTTTKEMLRAILSEQGAAHAAEASYNNHWGVPLTLARLPAASRFCVVEIGMNHPGEIEPLARLARPHVAVITTVEKAHVGHMSGIEGVAAEKATILRGLEPGGVAVLPADSPLLPQLRAETAGARTLTFGASAGADVRLVSVDPDATGSAIRLSLSGLKLTFRLNAPGLHMATNAACALAAAAALGADPGAAAEALPAFLPVSGRGARREITVPGGSALVLDESYNASSASVRAALAVLHLQPASRRIAVLGDMLELGDEGPAEHASLAPNVAAAADLLFTCGPLMCCLFDAVPESIRAAHAKDSASLAPFVARSVLAGDAILVKGSLGSRMKLVVAALDNLAETR